MIVREVTLFTLSQKSKANAFEGTDEFYDSFALPSTQEQPYFSTLTSVFPSASQLDMILWLIWLEECNRLCNNLTRATVTIHKLLSVGWVLNIS